MKDQEGAVRALKRAIKSGALADVFGTVGDLEAQQVHLEQKTLEMKNAIGSFKVHPQYEVIQQEADSLNKEIHDLTNQNVSERQKLTRYQESIKEETPPVKLSLEKLYEEVGVVFPDHVVQTLKQAKRFHKEIIQNRKQFLETEMKRLENLIEENDSEIKKLTDKRTEHMEILKTHGALQEFNELRERYASELNKLKRIELSIKEMKELEQSQSKVEKSKSELKQAAESDHEQRREIWTKSISNFYSNTYALYRSPGKLVIDIEDTGYRYNVEIDRSGSEGIDKMKIFCFDLTMLQRQIENKIGINFLIHDTLMYDAVDPRQRALAFEQAHKVTTELGGQYICTINSDIIPTDDFSNGFDFDSHVKLRLSDKEPSGRLLGMEFERPDSLRV